jgi:hypothetical protein
MGRFKNDKNEELTFRTVIPYPDDDLLELLKPNR